MQMAMNMATKEEMNYAWAFAVSPYKTKRKKVRRDAYDNSRISSCSRQARMLGIREGMKYQDAKDLVPDIKILVIGERKR